MKKSTLLLLSFTLISTVGFSQYTTDKVAGKKNEALKDSLKNTDYPYILPIWGDKVTKKGFDLPYSAGIGINYLWQQSDINIDNLQVGFNNKEMLSLDQVIRFDKAVSTANAVNLRPDFWLFPFLNIYGIIGVGKASTDVGFGVWVTDSAGVDKQILHSETGVDFNLQTYGFGMTPTIGVGGFWMALDMNCAWSDVPQLEDPAFSFVFGPRLGKSFKPFKNKTRNVAFWVGGFRLKLNSGTTGSLPLSDVYSADEMNAKVDQAFVQLDETKLGVDTWWNGLTPIEQANPVNSAKYNTANKTLDIASNALVSIDNAANNIESSSVQYSIDKAPATKWNFIVGGQFQINKHWMLRGEYGFLAQRSQFIGGLQYRFGL